jgi:hypothetical protein
MYLQSRPPDLALEAATAFRNGQGEAGVLLRARNQSWKGDSP